MQWLYYLTETTNTVRQQRVENMCDAEVLKKNKVFNIWHVDNNSIYVNILVEM